MQRGNCEDDKNYGSPIITKMLPYRLLSLEILLENLKLVFSGRAVQDTIRGNADVKVECKQRAALFKVTKSELVQLDLVEFRQQPVSCKSRGGLLVVAVPRKLCRRQLIIWFGQRRVDR